MEKGGKMITNTHILFSKILYENCLKDLNFKLDKYKFMYGNIKPDIFCNYFKDDHTIKGSIKIVKEYSNKLINSKNNISDFSVGLGVICHYVCDYFCIYHTEGYSKNNIFEHIGYERKLHNKVIHMIERSEVKIESRNNFIKGDVVEFIYKMQKKYFDEEQSLNRDIIYALETANAVTEGIVYYSILKSNHKSLNNLSEEIS